MIQQNFVFVGRKQHAKDNFVYVQSVVATTFDDNAPVQFTKYFHSSLKTLEKGYYLVSLTKAKSAKRKYLRSVISITDDENKNITTIWNESLTFRLNRAGEVSRINGNYVEENKSEVSKPVKPEPTAPEIDDKYFYVSEQTDESFFFVDVQRRQNPKMPVKVLMVGPSGFGKTSTPERYAAKAGLDFFRMNCPVVRDPEEWFGQRVAKDGSTMFVKSQFAKVLESGNAVIVLDEVNRIEPWLTNTLYPLLDDARGTTVYDGETISIGENVVFVGTMNLGHNYSGTFQIDAALSNRFSFICEVGPLPMNKEVEVLIKRTGISSSHATLIVQAADKIRSLSVVECSTRTTLMIALQVANGMSVRSAYQNIVVLRCNNIDARKKVIDVVNSLLGMYSPVKKFF